jgi:signal transduction histidine kinase
MTAPVKILVVDDDPTARLLMCVALQKAGFEVRLAVDGADALRQFSEDSFDLIMLDVDMPGMSGMAVCATLRAQSGEHLPIVMVTGMDDVMSVETAYEAGATDFIAKPINMALIGHRAHYLVRASHALFSLSEANARSKLDQEKVLSLNADLEERVRQRTAQLQVANHELEAFSYSVSHDLRTPLTIIAGYSSLLGKEMGTSAATERGKDYLERISAGVVQMGELIDALLALAQVSRTSLRRESVDLSALAETLLNSHREREPGRLAQLVIQPGLVVQGDPGLLRQVLDNLLGNAWKYSSKQPQTHIAFVCESGLDGAAVYAVRDHGAGFDMAYSDKLFGAFQRLHTASEFEGTGIGLATVHKIITRHGGRIWAESAPGQGATFYFTLGA